jgi:6-phosphogluconolactonase (cycloisomerase 2 family)
MDEDQEYLYVIVSGEDKIYQYLINHEDGSLTKTGMANTGYLPVSIAVSPHFFY